MIEYMLMGDSSLLLWIPTESQSIKDVRITCSDPTMHVSCRAASELCHIIWAAVLHDHPATGQTAKTPKTER
jgi:hypothetical protein